MAATETTYRILHLEEAALAAGDGDRRRVPLRRDFDIGAFGVNAVYQAKAGEQLVMEHDELGPFAGGHEELYLVVQGGCTFTIDGDEVDAPARTLVYVRNPDANRGAVAKEPGTIVLAVGAQPDATFEPSDFEVIWPYMNPAFDHYRAGRYAEAAQALREGLGEFPESAGLRYNLACFACLAGERESALAELREAIRREPRFRETAREDEDFASLRGDREFEVAVA
jgi:tetratricopeptide (TPR) repeat protein